MKKRYPVKPVEYLEGDTAPSIFVQLLNHSSESSDSALTQHLQQYFLSSAFLDNIPTARVTNIRGLSLYWI